jgi:hypothetical protein
MHADGVHRQFKYYFQAGFPDTQNPWQDAPSKPFKRACDPKRSTAINAGRSETPAENVKRWESNTERILEWYGTGGTKAAQP